MGGEEGLGYSLREEERAGYYSRDESGGGFCNSEEGVPPCNSLEESEGRTIL